MRLGLATALLLVPLGRGLAQPPASPACADDPAFAALDFWVGDWSVRVGSREVGTNRIRRSLDGCAVVEEWTAGSGGRGRSLFYYVEARAEWRQVWVTDRAAAIGGVKEKRLVAGPGGGALRFEGVIDVAGGGTYLDRTTLTPLPDGRVRQHIEVSTDRGASWRTTFDAEYVPRVSRPDLPTPETAPWREGPWPGVSVATLESDGEARTFWMRLPHGFWILPHTHPSAKRVNVIQGALRIGHGAAFEPDSTELLGAGGFMVVPPDRPHFEGAVGETIVQFSAVGPWATRFLQDGPGWRRLP